jgi:Fe-S cluster biosynthesis and repair protein YggX
MMSTCCSKHVEAWNKYIKKQCVKLVINQNYVKMHGQQNVKYLNTLTAKSSLYEAEFLEEIVKHRFLEMLKFI